MKTLITGASSGIGAETAIRLSASRNIVLCGRDTARLEEVRARCTRPETHCLLPLDLSAADTVAAAMEALLQSSDAPIDAFVHCAGIDADMAAKSFDIDSVRELMQVNVFSAMQIVRVLLRKNNRNALKNIVLISSVAAVRGEKGKGFYSASKGALDAWMRSLAAELAPAVRVNAILPGAVSTPLTRTRLDDASFRAALEAVHPLGLGMPADIAGAVDFLLSDNARWITGQALCVDGGYSL